MPAQSMRPAARRLGCAAVRASLLWGVKPCHTYRLASHGGHGLFLWWDTVEFQGTGRHQPRVFASMQRYHGGDWRNERGSKWSGGNHWWAVALPVAAALVVGAGRARGQVSHADAVVPKEHGALAEVRQALVFSANMNRHIFAGTFVPKRSALQCGADSFLCGALEPANTASWKRCPHHERGRMEHMADHCLWCALFAACCSLHTSGSCFSSHEFEVSFRFLLPVRGRNFPREVPLAQTSLDSNFILFFQIHLV